MKPWQRWWFRHWVHRPWPNSISKPSRIDTILAAPLKAIAAILALTKR